MPVKFFNSFCIGFFFSFITIAQTYLGVSANFGNQLKSSPAEGLKAPIAISGNLVLNVQETLPSGWAVQYGLGAGILGYNLKAGTGDVFREYADLYGRFHLLFGKEFLLKEKKWLLSLGGGHILLQPISNNLLLHKRG